MKAYKIIVRDSYEIRPSYDVGEAKYLIKCIKHDDENSSWYCEFYNCEDAYSRKGNCFVQKWQKNPFKNGWLTDEQLAMYSDKHEYIIKKARGICKTHDMRPDYPAIKQILIIAYKINDATLPTYFCEFYHRNDMSVKAKPIDNSIKGKLAHSIEQWQTRPFKREMLNEDDLNELKKNERNQIEYENICD